MTGSASLELYDPQEIVKMGKVIFVSMQYRLGAHGFLYFGKDSSAPGNVGLLDQVSKFTSHKVCFYYCPKNELPIPENDDGYSCL